MISPQSVGILVAKADLLKRHPSDGAAVWKQSREWRQIKQDQHVKEGNRLKGLETIPHLSCKQRTQET